MLTAEDAEVVQPPSLDMRRRGGGGGLLSFASFSLINQSSCESVPSFRSALEACFWRERLLTIIRRGVVETAGQVEGVEGEEGVGDAPERSMTMGSVGGLIGAAEQRRRK